MGMRGVLSQCSLNFPVSQAWGGRLRKQTQTHGSTKLMTSLPVALGCREWLLDLKLVFHASHVADASGQLVHRLRTILGSPKALTPKRHEPWADSDT